MTWRCKNCHSDRVQHAHWVDMNSGDVQEVFGSFNEPDAVYCTACESTDGVYDDTVEPITTGTLESAGMFVIFRGVKSSYQRRRRAVPRPWSIFNADEELFSEAVHDELHRRRLNVGGHIERDDQIFRHFNEGADGAPFEYDDLDASIDALLAGVSLVKVPDDLENAHFRMHVLKGDE